MKLIERCICCNSGFVRRDELIAHLKTCVAVKLNPAMDAERELLEAAIEWNTDDLRCVLIDGESDVGSGDGITITISGDNRCVEAFVPYLRVGEHIAIPLAWIYWFTVGLVTHPQD